MPQTDHTQAPLIIFDCDGVLVVSEAISAGLIAEYLGRDGLHISLSDAYRAFLGKPLSTVAQSVEACFGKAIPPFPEADFQAAVLQRFREALRPVPDVAWALAQLNGPRCVASSSTLERVALSLEVTGLTPLFPGRIFGAGAVKNGKPAPDLFLLAARDHGVDPKKCIVIEDSPAGLSAAKAAGMKSIGFVGGLHAGPAYLKTKLAALHPDRMIDTMKDLPATIDALGQTP